MVCLTWQRLVLAVNIGLSVSTTYGYQLSPRACTRTVKAKQGDTCASLSSAQGISVSEFLLDNPTITSCDLTAGSDYCVAEDGNGGTPSPSPTPSLVISTDGTCENGVTCAGSRWGACCSEHGYCGSTSDYCSGACQPAFGSCGAVSSSTSSGPITSPPVGTGTVWVTSTTIVTSTAVTSLTRTTTITVPATITSVVLTTSTSTRTVSSIALTTSVVTATNVVTRTAQVSSTAIVTYTSLVFATSTSLVINTSTRILTSTSLIIKTATSLILGTATVTVTADRTVATTTLVTAACSPTKPDTPITSSRTTRPPTQTPTYVPNPVFPGTISTCKKYYQIRDDDTCQSIIGSNGITFAQFYAWNPSVSCDNLWDDYYVCIGA